MADVTIYVAAITAGAAIIGTAVPQLSTAIRESHQAERDRQERKAQTRYQACVDLLRAAGELRTQVANNRDYHGPDMGVRLAEVRRHAAATELYAASVALLVPGDLGARAGRLAAAATTLTAAVAVDTDLRLGEMIRDPDFGALDECISAFREQAIYEVGPALLVGKLQSRLAVAWRQRRVRGIDSTPG